MGLPCALTDGFSRFRVEKGEAVEKGATKGGPRDVWPAQLTAFQHNKDRAFATVHAPSHRKAAPSKAGAQLIAEASAVGWKVHEVRRWRKRREEIRLTRGSPVETVEVVRFLLLADEEGTFALHSWEASILARAPRRRPVLVVDDEGIWARLKAGNDETPRHECEYGCELCGPCGANRRSVREGDPLGGTGSFVTRAPKGRVVYSGRWSSLDRILSPRVSQVRAPTVEYLETRAA